MMEHNDIQSQVDEIINSHTRLELGDKVVDIVTGLSGIVTMRTEILGGSTQVCVEYPHLTEFDGIEEETWLPEGRLRKVIENDH
jgi:hypothetical protein